MQHAILRKLEVLMWIIIVPKLASFQDLLHFRVTFYDRKETLQQANHEVPPATSTGIAECAGPNTAKRIRWNEVYKTERLQYTGGSGSKITR